ncbi:hypothetical protein BC941DRAFT_497667 [Chlamydoabsidia padenii]|nr:hypothetical protein BC941DRAFT_497667 [Chlamydoabsidia padenii]
MVSNKSRIGRLSLNVPTVNGRSPTTLIKTATKQSSRSCQSSSRPSTTNKDNNNTDFDNNGLTVGQKVSVASLCAFGTVRYIGMTSFKQGLWVGVELDIVGSGKNDGSIKGIRYFNCPPETGLFIVANKVTPLKASTPSSSSRNASIITPKKSLTLAGQRQGTKTPSTNDTITNKTASSRQRKSTTLAQPLTSTIATATATKKKTPMTSSLFGNKTTRHQPHLVTTAIPSTASKSTKSSSLTTLVPTKTATPILTTPTKSSPIHLRLKQQASKSTRRTTTPTTTKKRNSTMVIKAGGPDILYRSKSTSTRQVVTEEELTKMHQLLEQSRQEKQRLSDEMNGKEAVWERLVTAKESYALQVQDMQVEITRLQDSLQLSRQQSARLESQLKATPRTEEQNYNTQRIDKLERLVQQWQQEAQDSNSRAQQQEQVHVAQLEQLRRDLAERDQVTATMERNYESAKLASTESIRHYQSTMAHMTGKYDQALTDKDNEIKRLGQIIDELKTCHFLLPPSPNNEEDQDDDNHDDGHQTTMGSIYSSRRRLEQQLELMTQALDDLQQQQRATVKENEQLRDQLAQMHAASHAADQQYQQLQRELAKEIIDKRLVMEERDAGLQKEDEHKSLMITNTRLEHQLGDLTVQLEQLQDQLGMNASNSMESECGRLVEDMVELKHQLQHTPLESSHHAKLGLLYDDIARLESQVDEKDNRILELEALYKAEQQKTKQRLEKKKKKNKKTTMEKQRSSIFFTHDMPLSPISDTASINHSRYATGTDDDMDLYCEICEHYGHDVIGCNALNSMSFGEQTMVYCVNCDLFDTHPTTECPNQDESF